MTLTAMLTMTDEEIDRYLDYGLHGLAKRHMRKKERVYRRDECQYDRYADDWERESDAY